ncbi:unnamed protein product [Schistosoma turkestanicum]|nr:unnamed protein product [Schistosoma turkestanicum]
MLKKAIDSMLILLRFDERKDDNWLWNPTVVDTTYPVLSTTTTTTSTTGQKQCDNHANNNNSNTVNCTTPLLSTDCQELLSLAGNNNSNNHVKINRAKSIPNRHFMHHCSSVNYHKQSKRINSNNNTGKCNNNHERKTNRKHQFHHVRLHSYDESMKNSQNDYSYYEDGEFGTDVTYLPLSEFNHSIDRLNKLTKTTINNHENSNNTQTSKLTIVDEQTKNDKFNTPSLPPLLHSLSQIVPQKLKPPPKVHLSLSIPTVTLEQLINVNSITTSNSTMVFKNVDQIEQNKMDDFRFLVNFNKTIHCEEFINQSSSSFQHSSHPYYRQQELCVTTQHNFENNLILFPNMKITENIDSNNNNNNNNNKITKDCLTDFVRSNQCQKMTYFTPVTGISSNGDAMQNNTTLKTFTTTTPTTTTTTPNTTAISTTTTTTTNTTTTNTTTITTNKLSNHDATSNSFINHHYSSHKPLSPNIHFNTSRSNSGHTLIDQSIEQNYPQSRMHRLKKSTKKKRRINNSALQQHSMAASFSSSSSCFMNSTINDWSKCQYQKHWSFTFYDFENEQHSKEDDTALVHSVFAVVAARLQRQKHNGSKSMIKKVSEYEKLYQGHENNDVNRNNHVRRQSNSHQTSKQIHQHIRLANYIAEDFPKQTLNNESNNNDEQHLWRLCIKWNPKDLPNKSTLCPNTQEKNENTTENLPQIKLKKTHILATLGAEIDKTSLWSNNSTLSLISLDIHGLDRNEKKRPKRLKHRKHSQKHHKNASNQNVLICSVCKRLVNTNPNEQVLQQQMNANNALSIIDQTSLNQFAFNRSHSIRFKEKFPPNKNSEMHDYSQQNAGLTKLNNDDEMKYKRNSCHILPKTFQCPIQNCDHNMKNLEECKNPCSNHQNNLYSKTQCDHVLGNDCCQKQISENIHHDQCEYQSKLIMNSLNQTTTNQVLNCQYCLFKSMKGYTKESHLNGFNHDNNSNDKILNSQIKSNYINDNSTLPTFCCNQCQKWFIPPTCNQFHCSRSKRTISKETNLASYNHCCYHRSSSQPQTRHERIIQNHLSRNNPCNYADEYKTSLKKMFMHHGHDNSNNNIQCYNVQNTFQSYQQQQHRQHRRNQQSSKRQSQHRQKRTKKRAKSYIPIHHIHANDTTNNQQLNNDDSPIKFNHYTLELDQCQKEIINHQIIDNCCPIYPIEYLMNLKQDHKFKRYNRKYLGQLNVQEWLGKTLPTNND